MALAVDHARNELLAEFAELLDTHPDTHVLVLTMFDSDSSVFAAVRAGAGPGAHVPVDERGRDAEHVDPMALHEGPQAAGIRVVGRAVVENEGAAVENHFHPV